MTLAPRLRVALLAALVVLLAGGAAAVFVVRRDDGPTPPPPLDVPKAEQHARAACAGLATFEEQIRTNARSDEVLRTLGTATDEAQAAADSDARWRSLASGMDALQLALRENDRDAARVGIDVARAQCAEAG